MAGDYQGVLDMARKRAFNHLGDETAGWTVSSKSTKDVKIESKSSDILKCSVYRMTTTVRATPQVVMDTYTMVSGSKRREWDSEMGEVNVLERFSESVFVQHITTNAVAMGVISPREFVDIVAFETDGDRGICFYGGSIPNYATPKTTKKFVRGISACFLVKATRDPIDPALTKVMTISEMDTKGMIPRTLIDSAIPSVAVQEIGKWKAYLSEKGLLTK